jgi:V8-like Glu-specific endopeptidase
VATRQVGEERGLQVTLRGKLEPLRSKLGKLVAEMPDGRLMNCTASVITSDTKSAVWTAGHCIHPGDGSGAEGYYDNIAFIPSARGGDTPWGVWEFKEVYTLQDWSREGDSEVTDMAAVILREYSL